MNHIEESTESHNNTANFGMNPDDVSMLNQVLQQVRGISGVSEPAYRMIDSTYDSDI